MATQIPVTEIQDQKVQSPQRHWLEVLHDWVTTVDHKKIGLMYIGYALIFLVIAGFEALLMRVQLAIPITISSRRSIQRPLHHARNYDGVLRRNADPVRVRKLPDPADDRRSRYGISEVERLQFLDICFWRFVALFSYVGGSGLYGAGSAPDVGWFAYAPLTARVFSPGHSTDYWTLSLLLTGIGTIGTALNIVATIISMRCPG